MFDMDLWLRPSQLGFGPSTLDIFDPFDELDRLMSRNLLWLAKPEVISLAPKVPNKYRVTLDVSGYNAKSIKTEIKDGKLVVSGSEGSKHESDDFSVREFRKTFKLPENAESEKQASFITSNGVLVVEVPLKETQQPQLNGVKCDALPRIVEGSDGAKSVSVNLALPKSIDPAKLTVTCKDRDLIIKAEDKAETSNGFSSLYFYKRTTLPENTDFGNLKCNFDNNCLSIAAPLLTDFKPSHRTIPIEFTNKTNQIE
jgi:HSP20 family molecular chaperone IbpA